MANNKIDWEKIVSESSGSRLFLPEKFKKAQDDLEKVRKAFNEQAVKMAEKQIKMNMATQEMFLEIRNHLAGAGYPDIWVKEIGLDANALDDGKYVLNIRANNG